MKSLARLGESVSSPPTGASDIAALAVMVPIIGTGCDTKRACLVPTKAVDPFAKTKPPPPLTLQLSSNTFALPVGGDLDPMKGKLWFSRIEEAPVSSPTTRPGARFPGASGREPREGRRLRSYAPSGFLTFRVCFQPLAKINEAIAKINHGFGLSCGRTRSTFRLTPKGLAPEAPVRRGQER